MARHEIVPPSWETAMTIYTDVISSNINKSDDYNFDNAFEEIIRCGKLLDMYLTSDNSDLKNRVSIKSKAILAFDELRLFVAKQHLDDFAKLRDNVLGYIDEANTSY